MQAMMGMQKHKGLLEADEDKPVVIDQDGNEDDNADQIMSLFAMAIEDGDKFQKVCTDIQSVMTNNAIIARISDGHNTPISEAAWNGIAETNGIDGMNKVLSVFSGFFLTGQQPAPSQSATGLEGLRTSASASAVDSIVGLPSVTRLGR
jgi:hypothetical protein